MIAILHRRGMVPDLSYRIRIASLVDTMEFIHLL